MSFLEPITRDDADPSNLEEAVAFLKVAYQEAAYYDNELLSSSSTDPSDPYEIQALYEARSAWGIYQYAKTVVESFDGHVGYVTNKDSYTTTVLITDSLGTELLTYEL